MISIYYQTLSISFSFSNIKFKENNIPILYYVLFSILFILSLRFNSILISVLHQVFILHYLCANKAFLKICMDHSCCLRSFGSSANGPRSHLIFSRGKVINKIKSGITIFYYFRQHAFTFRFFRCSEVFLILSTIRYNISRNILGDPCF